MQKTTMRELVLRPSVTNKDADKLLRRSQTYNYGEDGQEDGLDTSGLRSLPTAVVDACSATHHFLRFPVLSNFSYLN